MTPEIARAALTFMDRVQLQGTEVQAWIAVVAALRQLAADEQGATPAAVPEAKDSKAK